MRVSIAAALLLFSTPGAAQITFENAAPAAAPPNSTDARIGSRMVCERQDVIGTRLGGTKVCMTWAEWQELKFRHREQLDKVEQQATAIAVPGR